MNFQREPEEDADLEQSFPKWKIVNCMFCDMSLRLIRRTLKAGQFYYVEATWADDFRNHECERKVPLRKVPVDKIEKPRPVYGPWKVDWSIPYDGPRKKKLKPIPRVAVPPRRLF